MPREGATILHADLDAFYASVAQRDDPRLRGRPTIVGPGVVLAASYEARACGVHSGMGAGRARALCPPALFVPPDWRAYTAASRAVFALFADAAPFVEALSIDEAFLDVSGLERISGSPEEIARRLRARVREEVGLPISVGIASTKFLAKVASGEAKPDGLLHVAAGQELDFLHPLPVERLWGVGPATARRLHAVGLRTVADVAALAQPDVVRLLGRAGGRKMHALAHNRDLRRVGTSRERRSVGAQAALGRRPRTAAERDAVLVGLVDRVARRLRAKRLAGRTVVLRLRFADYRRVTRSTTLRRPTDQTRLMLDRLRGLLAEADGLVHERGLTLLGVAITNLQPRAGVQLELALNPTDTTALDRVTDEIRDRFGTRSVTRAVRLGARDDWWEGE